MSTTKPSSSLVQQKLNFNEDSHSSKDENKLESSTPTDERNKGNTVTPGVNDQTPPTDLDSDIASVATRHTKNNVEETINEDNDSKKLVGNNKSGDDKIKDDDSVHQRRLAFYEELEEAEEGSDEEDSEANDEQLESEDDLGK